jgi:hypothetical protein
MIHRANADFWNDYHVLPMDVRARADKQFALLKTNPQQPRSGELAKASVNHGRRFPLP